MRKIFIFFIILIILALVLNPSKLDQAKVAVSDFQNLPIVSFFHSKDTELKEARSALLVTDKKRNPIYAKSPNEAVPIASLTKLMTTYIVLQAFEKNELSKNETLILTHVNDPEAVLLQTKTKRSLYTAQDLLAAMLIMSANDAAETFGKRLTTSHRPFVEKMNSEARKLGLSSKTKFTSASGLDRRDGGVSTSTANDLRILTEKILTDYPEILKLTAKKEYRLTDGYKIQTTNPILAEGANSDVTGLKTGFTDQAGYCLILTTQTSTERKIAIILGSKSEDDRKKAAYTLLQLN